MILAASVRPSQYPVSFSAAMRVEAVFRQDAPLLAAFPGRAGGPALPQRGEAQEPGAAQQQREGAQRLRGLRPTRHGGA